MNILKPKFDLIEKPFLNGSMRSKNDITNNRYGSLTMIEPSPFITKGGSRVWVAHCDCGNFCYSIPKNVKSGKTSSCGCAFTARFDKFSNKKDYSNQKYGRVTLISPTNKRYDRRVVWEAKCDCGVMFQIDAKRVTSGNTSSCGCLHTESSVLNGTQNYTKMKDKLFADHGVYFATQLDFVKEKIIATTTKKYGVPHTSQSPAVQEKRRQTCINKFGGSSPISCPDVKARIAATCLERYGEDHPMHVPEIAAKAAKNSCKSTVIPYWKDGSDLVCTASYEIGFVNYMNALKIDFNWQVPVKLMNCLYIVDCFVPSWGQEGTWVEIKGYWRGDAKVKWKEFCDTRTNVVVLDAPRLKWMGII
jgi:hypothetical protein